MQVGALCWFWATLFLQLTARTQKVDAAFWIVPSRLQLFEYEPVSFACTGVDGSTGWNILRRAKTEIATCGLSKWGVSTESSCSILGAFPDDSGEYWCEAGGGKRSSSVNITVTNGSVVLESPVLSVMEGEAVLLRCRTKTASSNFIAGFYKDGLLIGNSSTGDLILLRISKSDEGLYQCKVSDVGESPESRLTVRAPHTETPPCSGDVFFIFRSIIPVVLMAPLLLLLALLHCGNLRADVSCGLTLSRREDSHK